jgi:hypothetical protein
MVQVFSRLRVKAAASDLVSASSLTQDGITATMDAAYQTGQHVDGTYYIIANSNTVGFNSYSISGGSQTYPGIHAMIDPATNQQAFDDRDRGNGRGPVVTYNGSLGVGGPSTPFTVTLSGSPRTVWFYRGVDTIGGAQETGCYAIFEITIYPSYPGANAIKPTGLFVAGGKPCFTRSNINFNLYSQIPIPSGAIGHEPDWTVLKGYHKRPLKMFGRSVDAAFIAPLLTQDEYSSGTQGSQTGQLILGAISDSANRQTLIERIVRDGLEVDASIALGHSQYIANGGFGESRKILRYLAGKWLGRSSMLGIPATVAYSGASTNVQFFHEDGSLFDGGTRALYGTLNNTNYPTPPYHDNHDVRDSGGVREPHWVLYKSGTAQTSALFSITLQAGTTGIVFQDRIYITGGPASGELQVIMAWDNTTKIAEIASVPSGSTGWTGTATTGSHTTLTIPVAPDPNFSQDGANGVYDWLYIASGTGSGQARIIRSYNAGTKVITVDAWGTDPNSSSVFEVRRSYTSTLWVTPPTSSSTYETYNGGGYQADATRGGMTQTAIALVLIGASGDTADWSPRFFEYCKRWVADDGFLTPRYPTAFLAGSSNNRLWLDSTGWTSGFYGVAAPLWP